MTIPSFIAATVGLLAAGVLLVPACSIVRPPVWIGERVSVDCDLVEGASEMRGRESAPPGWCNSAAEGGGVEASIMRGRRLEQPVHVDSHSRPVEGSDDVVDRVGLHRGR